MISMTSYLGPDNIWLGMSTGFTRKSDGNALISYVVVWTRMDLRGHCRRSRSWNAAVRLASSIITGLSQAVLSALEAFLHYRLTMNHNLACHYMTQKMALSSRHAVNETSHYNSSSRVKSSTYSCFPGWVSAFLTCLQKPARIQILHTNQELKKQFDIMGC